MDVHITQFNVQLYFRQPVLDSEILKNAFTAPQGFEANRITEDYGQHPMQNTMAFYRQGFRIMPVQSNVLPFRILQVMSYPNSLQNPDSETLECLQYVFLQLKELMQISVERDVYAVRVVFHSIVTGSDGIHRVLSKLSKIDGIPALAGKYVAHRNPMDAVQLVTKTGDELSQPFWSDIRVSQFNSNSYVVTIFNETDSVARSLDFIRDVKQFVLTMMQEMEAASQT